MVNESPETPQLDPVTAKVEQTFREAQQAPPADRESKRLELIEFVVLGVPVNSHREGGMLNQLHELTDETRSMKTQLTKLIVTVGLLSSLMGVILEKSIT